MLSLIEEAVEGGARRKKVCELLRVSARMIERWRKSDPAPGATGRGSEDLRRGPNREPANKLSCEERARALGVMTAPRFRDLSVNQIVPLLADEGTYVGSEATLYRILREEELLAHRGRAKEPEGRSLNTHVATGPNQVWSWDITYLSSPVRGVFFYLYLMMDVWSRKVVGAAVHALESADLASELFRRTCLRAGINPAGIVLHADNGGPMKGATMLATLEKLGVLASFSRPRVSDDNPFSESLFRTLKYRPEYPEGPFADLEAARAWVESFVRWYNTEHLHSGIRFVTPEARHSGQEEEILAHRREVYERARARHPERWARGTRNWNPVAEVRLNPPKARTQDVPAERSAA